MKSSLSLYLRKVTLIAFVGMLFFQEVSASFQRATGALAGTAGRQVIRGVSHIGSQFPSVATSQILKTGTEVAAPGQASESVAGTVALVGAIGAPFLLSTIRKFGPSIGRSLISFIQGTLSKIKQAVGYEAKPQQLTPQVQQELESKLQAFNLTLNDYFNYEGSNLEGFEQVSDLLMKQWQEIADLSGYTGVDIKSYFNAYINKARVVFNQQKEQPTSKFEAALGQQEALALEVGSAQAQEGVAGIASQSTRQSSLYKSAVKIPKVYPSWFGITSNQILSRLTPDQAGKWLEEFSQEAEEQSSSSVVIEPSKEATPQKQVFRLPTMRSNMFSSQQRGAQLAMDQIRKQQEIVVRKLMDTLSGKNMSLEGGSLNETDIQVLQSLLYREGFTTVLVDHTIGGTISSPFLYKMSTDVDVLSIPNDLLQTTEKESIFYNFITTVKSSGDTLVLIDPQTTLYPIDQGESTIPSLGNFIIRHATPEQVNNLIKDLRGNELSLRKPEEIVSSASVEALPTQFLGSDIDVSGSRGITGGETPPSSVELPQSISLEDYEKEFVPEVETVSVEPIVTEAPVEKLEKVPSVPKEGIDSAIMKYESPSLPAVIQAKGPVRSSVQPVQSPEDLLIQELQEDNQRLNDQFDTVVQELNKSKDQAQQLKERNLELDRIIAEMGEKQGRLTAAQEEEASFEQKRLTFELQSLQNRNVELQERVNTLLRDKEIVEGNVKEIEKKVLEERERVAKVQKEAQQNIADAKGETQTAKVEVQSLQEQNKSLQKEVSAAKEGAQNQIRLTKEEAQKSIEEVKAQLQQRMEAERSEQQRKVQEKQEVMEERHKAELERKNIELAKEKAEKEKMQEVIREGQEEREKIKRESQAEIELLKGAKEDAVRAEREELEEKHKSEIIEKQQRSDKIQDQARKEVSAIQKEAQDKVKALQEEIKSFREQNNVLQNQANITTEKLRKANEDIEKSNQDLKDTQEKLQREQDRFGKDIAEIRAQSEQAEKLFNEKLRELEETYQTRLKEQKERFATDVSEMRQKAREAEKSFNTKIEEMKTELIDQQQRFDLEKRELLDKTEQAKQQDAQKYQDSLRNMEGKYEKSLQDINDQRSKEQESLQQNFQQQLEDAQRSKKALESELARVESESKRSQEKEAELNMSIQKGQEKTALQEKALKEKDERINKLMREIESIQESFKKQKENFDSLYKNKERDLQDKLRDYQKAKQDAEQKVSETVNRNRVLQGDLAQSNARIEDAQSQALSAKRRAQESAEIARQQAQEEQEKMKARHRAELEKKDAYLVKEKEELEKRYREWLANEKDQYKVELGKEKAEKEKLQNILDELIQERSRLTEQVSQLSQKPKTTEMGTESEPVTTTGQSSAVLVETQKVQLPPTYIKTSSTPILPAAEPPSISEPPQSVLPLSVPKAPVISESPIIKVPSSIPSPPVITTSPALLSSVSNPPEIEISPSLPKEVKISRVVDQPMQQTSIIGYYNPIDPKSVKSLKEKIKELDNKIRLLEGREKENEKKLKERKDQEFRRERTKAEENIKLLRDQIDTLLKNNEEIEKEKKGLKKELNYLKELLKKPETVDIGVGGSFPEIEYSMPIPEPPIILDSPIIQESPVITTLPVLSSSVPKPPEIRIPPLLPADLDTSKKDMLPEERLGHRDIDISPKSDEERGEGEGGTGKAGSLRWSKAVAGGATLGGIATGAAKLLLDKDKSEQVLPERSDDQSKKQKDLGGSKVEKRVKDKKLKPSRLPLYTATATAALGAAGLATTLLPSGKSKSGQDDDLSTKEEGILPNKNPESVLGREKKDREKVLESKVVRQDVDTSKGKESLTQEVSYDFKKPEQVSLEGRDHSDLHQFDPLEETLDKKEGLMEDLKGEGKKPERRRIVPGSPSAELESSEIVSPREKQEKMLQDEMPSVAQVKQEDEDEDYDDEYFPEEGYEQQRKRYQKSWEKRQELDEEDYNYEYDDDYLEGFEGVISGFGGGGVAGILGEEIENLKKGKAGSLSWILVSIALFILFWFIRLLFVKK